MINAKQVIIKLKQDIFKSNNFKYIKIMSFKKDRFLLLKKELNFLYIEEFGFKKMQYKFSFEESNYKNILKMIKELIDFEFPNSTMLWYYITK